MKKTQTQTVVQTTTNTLVGVAVMGAAALAAAAGFVIAASGTGPILIVKALPNPASHSTVVGSFEQVINISLQAKNKPITVDRLMFTATADTDGSFASIENNVSAGDHITGCTLNNSQGAAVGQGQIVDNLGNISFTNLSMTIPANVTRTLRLWCTYANVPTDGGNADIYAFSLKTDASVTAHGDQGGNLPGSRIYVGGPTDPGVNAPPTISVTVRDAGTLSAAFYSTAGGGIALAGTPLVNTTSYAFSATNEPYVVQTLTLKNTGNDAAIQAVKIKYLDQMGATIVKTAVLSNHIARFTGLNMYVPAGASNRAVVDVAVDTAPITTTSAAKSGMNFGLDLDFSATGNFKAVAQTSGIQISEGAMGASIHADSMVLRKTRPYIFLSSASPSGAAVPGQAEALRFNVTTAPGGPVYFQQFMIRLNSTDNAQSGWNTCAQLTTSKWSIKDFSTGAVVGTPASWRLITNNGSACATNSTAAVAYAIVTFNKATGGLPVVPMASSGGKAFQIFLDTTGASSSQDDSVRLELVDELTANATNNDAIRWQDADTGVSNIDGNSITNLPISGSTLVY